MSKLNPNAGDFSAPVAAPTSFPVKKTSASTSLVKEKISESVAVAKTESETPASTNKTALERATDFGHDVAVTEDGEPISYEGYSPLHDRFIYSKEYLLAFEPLGDHVIKGVPEVVRNPTPPKKLGLKVNGRIVYTVAELLQFQALYEMMPEDFAWADTIGADAVMDDKKVKAKNKKDKNRQKLGGVMSYDASLVCYFNPTEYATAMNMGLYTGPPAEDSANGSPGNDGNSNGAVIEPINPVEEAIAAKRRISSLLDDVSSDTVSSILESFMSITITCTQTLQEIIDLLFDHAIANPSLRLVISWMDLALPHGGQWTNISQS
ncbi:hypothetical protein BBO99_00006344 [Phytophthora kernoviae]|uniref:Uncharacterized protein n=2 Tax=Phytophthora kernoviae TaxID=325452 RepID=A0A3R7JS88_9STRA|nr:hypothetical protein G195_007339 [Phytophthora kernoviae 00238/432]KAG2522920.1 hypothetical protein JM16_004259 [Phytophthora kernoviae]KAG2524507.1 hypothetical protein JM18_005374 [Phytophthora kernoviae]RLM95380.1 hypothetical protein BBI17_006499 [Phytophthora kernoviae]RLN77942.1 hypothetical protein BBO99_00006344 [Phytophthora kernoviae]